MAVPRDRVALNPLQWINPKPPPGEPPVWRYADPAWRAEQPGVHRQIRGSGFGAVMLEVLDTQTLQSYAAVLRDAGLRPAPGYAQIGLPEDHGLDVRRGSPEWVRWFNPVRRKAEESNHLGLGTIFLAPALDVTGPRVTRACARGDFFDAGRLERQAEYLAEAAQVLRSEGIRAGLHNHVGSWIETAHEIDVVMQHVDADLLGASFDVGHLAWAGIDPVEYLTRYRHRLVDVHVKDLDLAIAAASRATPTSYYDVSDQRFFLEPGRGDIDLAGVVGALGDDFAGWVVVEVDRASTPDPFESACACWEWVERTFPA